MKNYELIEHTADIRIKVKGKDLRGLFKNSALAVFDIIAEPKTDGRTRKAEQKKFFIKQQAGDLEELFINWLNELLSLSSAKDAIFYEFRIDEINRNSLQAEAIGGDIQNYKANVEIKAATYHELEIKEDNSGYEAKVIFDV